MTYASATRKPNPIALAGALGIPGGIAALLVVGLAVTVVSAPPDKRLKGETITETKLPPPPPPDKPRADPKTSNSTVLDPTLPPRPTLEPSDIIFVNPMPLPPGPGPGTSTGSGTGELVIPGPTPSSQLFDPIGVRPKNNPGRWVTNDDYARRWIMEEMAGTAKFALSIDASGRVTGCTITRSTGHAALDSATCDLVAKRARFDAARDGSGKPVAGSYTGTITWKIPE